MSVVDFKMTEEKVLLNHSIEKEKNIRQIGYFSSSHCVGKIRVGICWLLVELCERFTFFEVVCNMIPFCTVKLGYRSHQAAILNLCFVGASILSPVFAGWFADVCLGRNKLVYVCLFLHFLGECPLLTGLFCNLIEWIVIRIYSLYYFCLALRVKCDQSSKTVVSIYFIFRII